ncbi:MAG: hypothetical protein NTX75_14865 [Proteobacteria bacterium]|nr:hypothetical protein [Pseudomonadota bacterium]
MRDKASVALNAAEEIYEIKQMLAGQRFGYVLIESSFETGFTIIPKRR